VPPSGDRFTALGTIPDAIPHKPGDEHHSHFGISLRTVLGAIAHATLETPEGALNA
jgi:hypothetical protein